MGGVQIVCVFKYLDFLVGVGHICCVFKNEYCLVREREWSGSGGKLLKMGCFVGVGGVRVEEGWSGGWGWSWLVGECGW